MGYLDVIFSKGFEWDLKKHMFKLYILCTELFYANHQRFLATGISVSLSSTSCSKEVEMNHFDPSNQQNAKQILSESPKLNSLLFHLLHELVMNSSATLILSAEELDLGELDWLAKTSSFGDQPDQEALPAAEVPELSVSHLVHVHPYNKPMKVNKKPRLEIIYDDEDHFLVPDRGLDLKILIIVCTFHLI
ncbi:hypothetical protein N665_1151s0020 [Sinapis alba]|nr:hypothetical protein N665_1151s0020 [Sinapis alba]